MIKMMGNDKMRTGEFIPVMKPSYATYEEVMEAHNGRTYADVKHDGYRIQIHKDTDKLWMFTSNGNEYNYTCYPDITKIAEGLPRGIIEAEVVSSGQSHNEVFEGVKKRFRRSGLSGKRVEQYIKSGIIDETPLSIVTFDVIKFEKKLLIEQPFEERRKYVERLEGPGVKVAETTIVSSVNDLEERIKTTLNNREEGIVCKNPLSKYIPGGRTLDWVKFKRSETLDLAIVGLYKEEYSDLPITSVLCATYNNKTGLYETIGKIGVIRNKLALEIYPLVEDSISHEIPQNVVFSEKLERESYSKFVPHSYVNPGQSIVLECRALNLNFADNWQSCGARDGKAYSMRIGYAEQVRYDKSPRQATTTQIVEKLYSLQQRNEK